MKKRNYGRGASKKSTDWMRILDAYRDRTKPLPEIWRRALEEDRQEAQQGQQQADGGREGCNGKNTRV